MDWNLLAYLLVPAVLVLLPALMFGRARLNVRISVQDGEIEVAGQALQAKAVLVRNFWMDQMADIRTARIDGFWDGRRLSLSFTGELTVGQQQRIRNYLMTIL